MIFFKINHIYEGLVYGLDVNQYCKLDTWEEMENRKLLLLKEKINNLKENNKEKELYELAIILLMYQYGSFKKGAPKLINLETFEFNYDMILRMLVRYNLNDVIKIEKI